MTDRYKSMLKTIGWVLLFIYFASKVIDYLQPTPSNLYEWVMLCGASCCAWNSYNGIERNKW